MRGLYKKLSIVALAALLVLSITNTALAKTIEPYKYTVRIFAGNHGTVDASYQEITKSAGEELVLDTNWVTPQDGYYVRGFRRAGEDHARGSADWMELEPLAISSITEDRDYVPVYAVKGNTVPYTIRFVEYGTGKELPSDQGRTSVTFEGAEGDRFVVAYEYVPGYRPRYRNVTGTIRNGLIVDLEYIPLETEQTVETTPVVVEGQTTETAPTTTPATPTTTPATPVETTGGTETEGTDNEGTGTETTTTTTPTTTVETTPTNPPTEEILDVDNPLATPTQTDDGTGTDEGAGSETIGDDGSPTTTTNKPSGIRPFLAIILAAGLAALGGLLYFFFKRNQEEDETE